MGTNYYIKLDICPACNMPKEELHIGKSSAGWCFALHIIPEREINDLDDWFPIFKKGIIQNEYGKNISIDDMISIITEREWPDKDWNNREWRSYESEENFHEMNHSQRGPNGLLRARLESEWCIKHGKGTWDCIIGEFS